MALTDLLIRKALPSQKPYKMGDDRGLFLLVNPSGSKLWRQKYHFDGKEKLLSHGTYPELDLKNARLKCDEARRLLSQGVDPALAIKAQKYADQGIVTDGFEVVCREWLEYRKSTVEPAQHAKTLARFEKDVFPWLGKCPITQISAPDVLEVLRRIDQRGARYTAHRVRSEISRAFRYAVATGRAQRDPCFDLRGAIPPARETHFAAIISPSEVGELLRAIDAFRGTFVVQCALRLAPLVFVRPGELRQAKWSDIHFDKGEWRYFVNKTKTDHLVPLSRQALAILEALKPLTGDSPYVFPGNRATDRPMSDAAINAALRRLGYDTKAEITGHGFRAMARTILAEELDQKPEVIEHQLAHRVPDALGNAYNRTKFLKDRRNMMQVWADYLDKLKTGAEVIPLQQRTG